MSKVVKIDLQTESGTRGQFARFAVQVNLAESLISKVKIAKRLHRVEYESLPSICFNYGLFGHMKDVCSYDLRTNDVEARVGDVTGHQRSEVLKIASKVIERLESEKFGEWMVVERRQRRQQR